jgi:hypothetical protein
MSIRFSNPDFKTYAWTVNNGVIIGPNNQCSITVNWTTPVWDLLRLIEMNSLGCDSTDAQMVIING